MFFLRIIVLPFQKVNKVVWWSETLHGRKQRFFILPRWGSPSEYYHNIWYGKTIMAWLPSGSAVVKVWSYLLVSTEWIHERDNRTDGQTDTARRHRRHRPRLWIKSRGSNQTVPCSYIVCFHNFLNACYRLLLHARCYMYNRRHAVMRCPYVRPLSVRLSVTFVYSVETN